MSKSKDAQASKAVLDYLIKQNRPYSATDIFNNLHKEYGKTAVIKCLEGLTMQGKIMEKVYGKQKVYVADQSQFQDVDDAELKEMDSTIMQLSKQIKEVQTIQKSLDSELNMLKSSLTTKDAEIQLAEINTEILAKQKKLAALKAIKNSVSPAEREKIVKAHREVVKEWRKRKRLTNDILDAILEGYPKSKKDLYVTGEY